MPKDIGNFWTQYAATGADRAAKEFGVEVVVLGPQTSDPTGQINMMQDAIVSKPVGISIATADAAGCAPIIDMAIEQGIQVVTWDSDAPDSKRPYYVNSQSDYQNGPDLVEILVKEMGTKGKIALMVGGLSAGNTQDRIKGVEDTLAAKYPDIEILTTVASDDDFNKAYTNAQSLISAYGEELTGIIGLGGAEPSSAAKAVEEAVAAGTIKNGQIAITGLTVPSFISPYLKSGTVKTVQITEASDLGYCTIWVLTQLAQGKTFKDGEVLKIPGYNGPEGYPKVVGNVILIGIQTVTAENVDNMKF
jgi:ABC-type sugar transport system substrate-binding protein